jgi:hypothetical protein
LQAIQIAFVSNIISQNELLKFGEMYNYIEFFYSYVTTYSSLFSVRGKVRRHLEGIPIYFDE